MTERETEFIEIWRCLSEENRQIVGNMLMELAKRYMKGGLNNE